MGARGFASFLARFFLLDFGLAFVDVELPGQDVALVEPREYRLMVLAAIVAPVELIDQPALGGGLVVVDELEERRAANAAGPIRRSQKISRTRECQV